MMYTCQKVKKINHAEHSKKNMDFSDSQTIKICVLPKEGKCLLAIG